VRPSNRKHEFVRGACERKSVEEKLVHILIEGNKDQQSCKGFKLRTSRKYKCVFQIEIVVFCKRSICSVFYQ